MAYSMCSVNPGGDDDDGDGDIGHADVGHDDVENSYTDGNSGGRMV